MALTLAAGPGVAAAGTGIEANLKVVSRTGLGVGGRYGDVAVVGTTAVVATETPDSAGCPTGSATVVDIRDPRHPRVAATIPVPAGLTVSGIDAIDTATEASTGDLVALALAPLPGPCGDAAAATVAYYDVSAPSQPKALGLPVGCQSCGRGGQSVSLAQRGDGRVLAVRVNVAPPGVVVDDVSNPREPVALAQWHDPGPAAAGCGTPIRAVLYDDGMAALVTLAGGRVYSLDLTEPGRLAENGGPTPLDVGGRPAGATVVPLVNRTIAIVSDEGACTPGAAPGLRVWAVERAASPQEENPVRFPTAAAPGRLAASGSLAYVAWHGDGLRVVDFGQVKPVTVAQFVPPTADVVGVALLPAHIVVIDAASGLYVLERPDEGGGGRSGFLWQFLSLLPYLAFAMVSSAALLVPRLLMARARSRSGASMPSPARVRRTA